MHNGTTLELADIQSGVLRPRPSPFAATYIALRVDDRKAGREVIGRLANVATSAADPASKLDNTWASVALSYQGLKALGVPEPALDTLSWEFRQGMAARAADLGDVGDSSPDKWEDPFCSSAVHIVITAVSPTRELLEASIARARQAY